MMKKTMTAVIAAVFLVLLAPILATQVAAYAAQTSPTPNTTLVTVFNLMVWGIPLGIAAALIVGVFSGKNKED